MPKPSGLGRGLSSLIPNKSAEINKSDDNISKKATAFWGGDDSDDKGDNSVPVVNKPVPSSKLDDEVIVENIPVISIEANPYQPRQNFEKTTLNELKDSIRGHGILQPLVVSPHRDGYQLIAGERRLRSAQELGLKTVPAIIRDVTNQEKLELSLIENIQRQNLNAIEEAKSYLRLSDEFDISQEDIGKRVGKSRSKVTNSIRLLQLPEEVQQMIIGEKLTEGHGKILLELDSPEKQIALAKKIIRQSLTVRDTSDTVKTQKGINIKVNTNRSTDPRFKVWEQKLESTLGTRVNIIDKKGKGKVELEYFSDEELTALIEKLTDLDEF